MQVRKTQDLPQSKIEEGGEISAQSIVCTACLRHSKAMLQQQSARFLVRFHFAYVTKYHASTGYTTPLWQKRNIIILFPGSTRSKPEQSCMDRFSKIVKAYAGPASMVRPVALHLRRVITAPSSRLCTSCQKGVDAGTWSPNLCVHTQMERH